MGCWGNAYYTTCIISHSGELFAPIIWLALRNWREHGGEKEEL